MYDNEDEIRRKRRILIITIGGLVILIIALILFLLTRGSKKTTPPINTTPTCELEVKSGTLGENNVYVSSVVIVFKTVTPISENIPIAKKTVGISDNSRNKETYTITKAGKTKVYGYVRDANGNTGTCEIEVEVNPTEPTCELEIKSGTLGENDWYKSDVVIGFKSMDSNSETAEIEKFYIEKETTELESDEIIKSEMPSENIETYTVKENQITTLNGYVIDSNGNEGTCSITVKKDSDLPTCKLKVISGTQNSSGIYTSNVIVGMDTQSDMTSDIDSFGVGTSENYTQETFSVTANGTTVVYGYVKDKAGNKGTCSMSITRPTPTPDPDPEPEPTPDPISYPSCTLEVVGSSSGGTYIGTTTIRFKTKSSTNGATITSYGLGTSQQLNGKDSYVISTSGTHTIYGMVKDSYGKTATCGPVSVNVKMPTLLSQSVKIGDYVAYDAGTWSTTAAVPTTNGNFGGYTSGSSKNSSVKCRNEDTTTASGWKVLSISGNTVTIIHAGIPECYYHAATNATTAVSTLNNRARTTYMNSFASDARMLSYNDYNSNTSIQNIGSHYYIATAKDSTTLYYVSYTGRLSGGSARANGVRPVVVLKSNVKTTGKNSNGAWILVLDDSSKELDSNIELPNSYIAKINNIINSINEKIKELAEIYKEQ